MSTSQISVDDTKVSIEIADQDVRITAIEQPTLLVLGESGPQGPQGEQGIQGIQGEAATIEVGTVSTGAAGSSASVVNAGTENDAIFNFVIPRGDQGIQGIQGIPGEVQFSDLSYVHNQTVASNTWTIVHGLQFIPNVTIVDSAGSVVEGNYSYPDENTVIATFSGGFTGKAYLS
jgi:hypothetical protein